MNSIREKFDKQEKLCSRKVISGLFESENIFHNYLLKVVWGKSQIPLPYPAQVAFSVSKRGFRSAVTRNLIKRRMREAYRKNKNTLYDHLVSENIQIVFFVILKGDAVPDYLKIENAIKDAIQKLIILTTKN